MREAVSVGWRGVLCWVGAWDHVEVKMSTSEHLICVSSPFAMMVRAQARPQHCSSTPSDPFDEGFSDDLG